MQFEISKPTDDGAFEDMCARIYGTVFNDPLPQTNGRRGQNKAASMCSSMHQKVG